MAGSGLGWALAAMLAGCDGGGDADGTPPTTSPAPDTTEALGPLVLVTTDLVDAVEVPCEEVRVARIENRGAEEIVVDALTVTAEDEQVFGLAQVLEIPRIVRPGSAVEIPMRVVAAAPGVGRATVELVVDDDTFTAELEVPIGWGEAGSESFVTPLPPADVVLAVDHSAGMTGRRDDLEQALPQLVAALSEVADWRLILVTGDDGCNNGGVWTAEDAGAGAWIAEHALDDGGDELTVALLELASVALAQNASFECNGTFQRDFTPLHVWTVSDEPEQSGRDASWWVDDYHDYAEDVRVSAVAALGQCGDADGYEDAAEATDGELVDLCDAGWTEDLDRLADAIEQVPPAFPLAAAAEPSSVEAEIDGERFPATYDAERGVAIVPAASRPGTEVTVHYAAPGTCAE